MILYTVHRTILWKGKLGTLASSDSHHNKPLAPLNAATLRGKREDGSDEQSEVKVGVHDLASSSHGSCVFTPVCNFSPLKIKGHD